MKTKASQETLFFSRTKFKHKSTIRLIPSTGFSQTISSVNLQPKAKVMKYRLCKQVLSNSM